MARIVGTGLARFSYGGTLSKDFAFFSPNGRRFVIILRQGNLQQNTNIYSMLLFGIRGNSNFTRARLLVSFASSSNREAIKDPVWLRDDNTILFLGTRLRGTTQLFSISCSTGVVKEITHHNTNLVAYTANLNGNVVFAAEPPSRHLLTRAVLKDGLHVSNEGAVDLIDGTSISYVRRLYAPESRFPRVLEVHDMIYGDPVQMYLSPDGRRLVVETNVANPPESWLQYSDESLRALLLRRPPEGFPSWVFHYELIDLDSGETRPVLDSPIGSWGSNVAWSPDSRSIVVTGVYLPLNIEDATERTTRQKKKFVVEIRLPSLQCIKISDQDLQLVGWHRDTLEFRTLDREARRAADAIEFYRRNGDQWEPAKNAIPTENSPPLNLSIEQDLNTSPRIVAINPATGHKTLLLDPNPQLKQLALGQVKQIQWTGAGGHETTGALYLPPHYLPDRKYPLVIQTHGFDPHEFWIDGPFTTAFAAQALAGKDIIVLQVPDSHAFMNTPQEAPAMAETYEKAVDFLDSQGLIDRDRVGIVGFSRTGLYVRYLLTHSPRHFAAAVIADGFDDGYFNYLLFAPSNPPFVSEIEGLIGEPPFGDALAVWQTRSSGFRLDRVRAPVQLQASGPDSLLSTWDWFAGLKRLNKAVDLLYLPDGSHILEKPRERLASQEGMVDWICFWLKGEEDPNPSKAEQYEQWRNLRKLEKQHAFDPGAASRPYGLYQ